MPEYDDSIYNLYGDIDKFVYPPIENWLSAFNETEMVVTDSFHSTVFSIIFNKPFCVIGNEGCGMARFETLLSILTHYILDQSNELERLVEKVANDKSLSPFSLDLYKNRENPLFPPPQVEQWLAAFRDAEFVITDSFHACVFSIIFHKPFIVIGNKQRGYARFLSLLQAFGLQRNLITSVKDYNPDVDYSIPISTYSKLDEWRKLSFNFLEKYLS